MSQFNEVTEQEVVSLPMRDGNSLLKNKKMVKGKSC